MAPEPSWFMMHCHFLFLHCGDRRGAVQRCLYIQMQWLMFPLNFKLFNECPDDGLINSPSWLMTWSWMISEIAVITQQVHSRWAKFKHIALEDLKISTVTHTWKDRIFNLTKKCVLSRIVSYLISWITISDIIELECTKFRSFSGQDLRRPNTNQIQVCPADVQR